MAIRDDNGRLRGKVGLMTYRVVDNRSVVQSRPGKGETRMHAASLANSGEFALASNRARMIRMVLQPMLNSGYDKKMVNRLNVAVGKTIKSNLDLPAGQRDLSDGQLDTLAGFEFNLNAPFAEQFRQQLTVEVLPEGIQLRIPEFNPRMQLSFPPAAVACHLKVLLSAMDLENQRYCHCEMKTLVIPEGTTQLPETTWLFNQHLPENVLLILSATLEYTAKGLTENISLNSIDLNPLTLLGLFLHPGLQQNASTPDADPIWGTWFPIPGLDGKQLLFLWNRK